MHPNALSQSSEKKGNTDLGRFCRLITLEDETSKQQNIIEFSFRIKALEELLSDVVKLLLPRFLVVVCRKRAATPASQQLRQTSLTAPNNF
jgi:hypothetical protein